MTIKPFTYLFESFGRYLIMLKNSYGKPENFRIYWKECMIQAKEFIIQATPIVFIISIFAGAVTTIQIASQLNNVPFVPTFMIGGATRDTIFLEITPTFNGIVLAGVIGSKLTSEIGNMRLSEQIDAFEMMGINSKIFLINPRISSIVLITPFLSILSLFISVFGGKYAGSVSGLLSPEDFTSGFFHSMGKSVEYIYTGMIKSVLYAFLYSSIGCYFGYFVKGGSVDIGKATTRAVITSCIFILLTDYIVTSVLV